MGNPLFELPVFEYIRQVSKELNCPAYLVGGYVRDTYLKRQTKDIDVVVVGDGVNFAEKVAKIIPEKSYLTVFKTYGTANLKTQFEELEFVGARKESYQKESRNPIVTAGTLEDDLSRRDFTINAMAISLNDDNYGSLIDNYEGFLDLQDQILRTPLDPDITFSDDPLRMMRGIRFASQLDFYLCDETFDAIERNRERIKIITQERITEELNKIILSPAPSIGFKLLKDTGLLAIIFPELAALEGVKTVENRSHKDNFYHTLQVLDNIALVSNDLWLRWAAILHDIGKPASQRYDEVAGWTFHGHEVIGAKMTPKIFKKLRLPLDSKMKFVEKLVLLHLRPIALTNEVTDAAIRRLIVDAEEDIDALMMLCRADITSKNMLKVKKYLARFDSVVKKIQDVTERDELRNWKNPITGEMIMETFNIPASRLVGDIKDIIKEAIMSGEIPNDYDAAYQLMLIKGSELINN